MAGTGRIQRRLPSKPVPVVRERYLTGPPLNVPTTVSNLGDRYMHYLAQQPEKIHQVDAQTGTTETKGSLRERAIGLANAMLARGTKPDDRVICCSKCHFDMTVTLLACLTIGAVFVPINPDFTFDELRRMLSAVAPKMAFCDMRSLVHVDRLLKKLEQSACTLILYGNDRRPDTLLFNAFIAKQPKQFVQQQQQQQEQESDQQPQRGACSVKDLKQKISFIIPTQGTTGAIKLCECSSYSMLARTRVILDCFLQRSVKILSYLPINAADQLALICATLETNMTRVLPGPFSPRNLCKLVHDLQIDTTVISTEHSMQLLYREAGVYDFNLSCLETLLIIGHAISGVKMKSVAGSFPTVEIYNIYSTAEAGPISYAVNADGTTAAAATPSICTVSVTTNLVPGIQVYVQNDDRDQQQQQQEQGQEQTTTRCALGELMVGGPQLMTGYYKSSHTNATCFRRGFFRSGDFATYDDDGNLNVIGNSYDIVTRNESTFSAIKLEEIIAKFRGVREVAVISNEKEIVACIVKHESCTLTLDMLQGFVGDKVMETWLPNRLQFFNHFPKTTLGKVKKHALMEEVFSFERDVSESSSTE